MSQTWLMRSNSPAIAKTICKFFLHDARRKFHGVALETTNTKVQKWYNGGEAFYNSNKEKGCHY
jgi:hypothetical protein